MKHVARYIRKRNGRFAGSRRTNWEIADVRIRSFPQKPQPGPRYYEPTPEKAKIFQFAGIGAVCTGVGLIGVYTVSSGGLGSLAAVVALTVPAVVLFGAVFLKK